MHATVPRKGVLMVKGPFLSAITNLNADTLNVAGENHLTFFPKLPAPPVCHRQLALTVAKPPSYGPLWSVVFGGNSGSVLKKSRTTSK